MKRFEIAPLVGTGAPGDPIRPDVTGAYVTIGQVGGHALVKRALPDGAAAPSGRAADLDDSDPDGPAQDVTATALTAGQRTAIKAFLASYGIDASQFDVDGVNDRRKLLRFLLRRWLGWSPADFDRAVGSDYDATRREG